MKRIVYALLFLIFTVHSLFAQNTLTYQMVVRDDLVILFHYSPTQP
ncbi:MAG: hypothetical protein MJZ76_04745 [Bacteroidales bacterium]|nr:hypothetical protein [Bacteroidales bacterium]